MANCVTCKANCERAGEHHVKTNCISYVPKDYPKPRTNYDYLVSKPPEELAEWLSDMHDAVTCPNGGAINCNPSCKRCWLDWLKQEVDE